MKFVIAPVSTLLILFSTGCAELGVLSKSQSFHGRDVVTVTDARADMLDVIAAVGKSLKLDVSGLDRSTGYISLSSRNSTLETTAFGKVSLSSITVRVQDEGKKLDITVLVTGNFGSGSQDVATKLLDDFKERLRAKLGEKS